MQGCFCSCSGRHDWSGHQTIDRTLPPKRVLLSHSQTTAHCSLTNHFPPFEHDDMSLLSWAGRLYSLDTLDARFTTSVKSPPSRIDPAITSLEESRKDRNTPARLPEGANPPKWRSLEFMVYGLIFLTVVPLMFWTVYDVSQRKQPSPGSQPLLCVLAGTARS